MFFIGAYRDNEIDEEHIINELFQNLIEKHKKEKTGNYLPVFLGQPKGKIQGSSLMFAAVVEFKSLQEALDCYNSKEYQDALIELGDNPDETVVRNLSIFEGV